MSDNVLDFKKPSKASEKLVERKDSQKFEPSAKEKEVIKVVKKEERIEAIKKKIEKLKSI